VLSRFLLVTERESIGIVIRPWNLLKAYLPILAKVIHLTEDINRLANWDGYVFNIYPGTSVFPKKTKDGG